MRIDANLSSIHAYLCADGYMIKNPEYQKHKYYHIGFRNTDHTLLKDFQNKFYKIFKLKPHICKEGRCRIQSKIIYYKLTKKFGSFYSINWKLPNLNKNNLKFWLRSYFDCEAWVTNKERQNRHIGLDSINKEGLLKIKEALSKFKISSQIKKRTTRNIYTLHIFGKDNLIKFQKEINFLHPNKKEKLKQAINSYIDYNWHISKNDFKDVFKEKAKIKKDKTTIRLCSIIQPNLERISFFLKKLNINSKIYKRKNGLGKIYYELAIYKKENINKLLNLNLIRR